MPVGQYTVQRDLKRLGGWQLFGSESGVTTVKPWMTFIGKLQRRRRNIIGTAPDLYLVLPKFFSCLSLVQPLQGTIMALIQLPGTNDRQPVPVHFILNNAQRFDGTF